jgi:hypothetical protein
MNQRSKIGPTPHEKANWRCNSSEYNNRYQKFSLNQQSHAKPPAVRLEDNRETFRTGEEMFNTSSYMTDYAQKPSTAPIRIKRDMGPSSIASGPEAKMECYSSYKSYFDKKNAKPAKCVKPPPPQGLGWKTKNETEKENSLASVSMNCYRPYTAGEVQASQRHPIIISPEYGTIDINPDTRPSMTFQTTVQKNFVKHEGRCRPAPAPGAIKSPAHGIAGIAGADINAKMDLKTTHREVFHAKDQNKGDTDEAVPPLAKDKSAKTPKWYKSIEVDNGCEGDMSTQRSDYIHHSDVSRPKSFKPLLQYHQPDTKFETNTLYKRAFTIHGNQRRKPMVPAIRTKDEEIIRHVMSKEAIYDTEYCRTYQTAPDQFRRPKAIVPKTTNRTKGTFYGNTSYSANFHCDNNRHVPRMPSFKPKKVSDPWHKTGDSDDFRSTTREHYMGAFAKPASICRPKIKKETGITDGEGEARFDTEYSNCFDAPKAVIA